MAAFPQRASLCHLAPAKVILINDQGAEFEDKPGALIPMRNERDVPDSKIVCQFCGEACDFIPDFALEQTNLELVLRRYREGDMDFLETFDSVQEIAKREYVEVIDKISRAKWPRGNL